jgi:hypothetical protein
MGVLRRKTFEEIRSCLRPGMDFAKARRELSAEGFREPLSAAPGKGKAGFGRESARSDSV